MVKSAPNAVHSLDNGGRFHPILFLDIDPIGTALKKKLRLAYWNYINTHTVK